ncbi:hypothetical protein [Pelagibius sp. 7325]|uniref:hypothetical protein n=1 Tax=Pelagibius sp. 7325 TaxID=3131994 RepID=UPI0030EDA555
MDECSTGELIGSFVFFFLLIVLIHAAPMAYLFRRWGQRCLLGLVPAALCAMGTASSLSYDLPCGLIESKQVAFILAAASFSVCFLMLVFFKPDLRGDHRFTTIFLAILCFPLLGAIVATVWLFLSMGRSRVLLDNGRAVPIKDRFIETLFYVGVIIFLAAYIAYGELK